MRDRSATPIPAAPVEGGEASTGAAAPHNYNRYTHGCRCGICREAKRQYVAARRAAGREPTRAGEIPRPRWNAEGHGDRVGKPRFSLPDVTHGTTTGYRRGCRCWGCTDVATAANTDRYHRRLSAASTPTPPEPQ